MEVDYAESDGSPEVKTDLHREWVIRIIDLLKNRCRGQQVYVSGDLLVYYEQATPAKSVCSDAFVVKDYDPRRRRVYKI